MMPKAYWLTNVRLESGYRYENDCISATETELSCLFIKDGKVERILSSATSIDDQLPKVNGEGLLVLPSFKEKHFHLDKTYYGGEWKAPKKANTIVDRLNCEAIELPLMASSTKERAEQLLEMILDAGSTHIRTHVNIDPYIGLKNLESVRKALENYSDRMTWEIVAFPQHGLLRTQVKDLMRQAMQEGATLVGGLDPAGIDENLEHSLNEMMDIAVEADAGIDIHMHDPGHLGVYTMKKLADLTEEAGWQNKVAISHAFGLGGVPDALAAQMADRFIDLDISVISTAPIFSNYTIPPISLLKEKGVKLAIGCNSVWDTWGPFGNADILERLGRLAELYSWVDERSLAEALGLITGGKIPLDSSGNRIWPKIGDDASFVLVGASCSSEAVARRSKRHAVFNRGKLVAGTLGTNGV